MWKKIIHYIVNSGGLKRPPDYPSPRCTLHKLRQDIILNLTPVSGVAEHRLGVSTSCFLRHLTMENKLLCFPIIDVNHLMCAGSDNHPLWDRTYALATFPYFQRLLDHLLHKSFFPSFGYHLIIGSRAYLVKI
jgi:hypothetical protein